MIEIKFAVYVGIYDQIQVIFFSRNKMEKERIKYKD